MALSRREVFLMVGFMCAAVGFLAFGLDGHSFHSWQDIFLFW